MNLWIIEKENGLIKVNYNLKDNIMRVMIGKEKGKNMIIAKNWKENMNIH